MCINKCGFVIQKNIITLTYTKKDSYFVTIAFFLIINKMHGFLLLLFKSTINLNLNTFGENMEIDKWIIC